MFTSTAATAATYLLAKVLLLYVDAVPFWYQGSAATWPAGSQPTEPSCSCTSALGPDQITIEVVPE